MNIILNRFKNIDNFTKNIILVFTGSFLVNFLNLLYQLLIAHKLSPSDFADFNSLLSVFILISTPLGTLQVAVTKYCAEFNARQQISKIKFLLSDLFKKSFTLIMATFLIFGIFSTHIINALKISAKSCSYILTLLVASSWLNPVFSGGVQGLELFRWWTASSVVSGALKLMLAFIFILLGYNIAGALGALFISSLVGLIILYFPLRQFISLKTAKEDIDYKEMLIYLFPVAISYLCFITLVSSDMILVKYFFLPFETGLYSLAQMVGKIFLFLPGAISLVMFPRTSGLNAKNMDTLATLHRSLLYAGILCAISFLAYNLFPGFTLKVLTGKVYPESVVLGRFFSISMSFFALSYILITYFLSQKDLRFIKYLALFTFLQLLAIKFFHHHLTQVQLILCINAILLFLSHFLLLYRKGLSRNFGTVAI